MAENWRASSAAYAASSGNLAMFAAMRRALVRPQIRP
jgi:hypothetical protein